MLDNTNTDFTLLTENIKSWGEKLGTKKNGGKKMVVEKIWLEKIIG